LKQVYEDHCTFLSYLAHFFLEWEMFQTQVVEKIKTHFVFSNFFENRVVYEIKFKGIVEQGRPQMTIRRTHTACWRSKATNTHTKAV